MVAAGDDARQSTNGRARDTGADKCLRSSIMSGNADRVCSPTSAELLLLHEDLKGLSGTRHNPDRWSDRHLGTG